MPNRLIHETSPYLLQHAHNPVDWYAWGEAAFEQARKENKPILVSIGYATCHWCHVMERESFENEAVAAIMNANFVCIKIDREERPDIDQIYMDAVQAMGVSGGWPLNCFLLPDLKPFYGGTYFPPEEKYGRTSWSDLLRRISFLYQNQLEKITEQANRLTNHLQKIDNEFINRIAQTSDNQSFRITQDYLQTAYYTVRERFDRLEGGFGAAPKFPATMSIKYLLDYSYLSPNLEATTHALFSLDKMMAGGIYDQLRGGFSRYSTDRAWLAPHFEKMLYDNALLVGVLADAYKITKKADYKEVIDDTLAYIAAEMTSSEGLFYTAQDADSEGIEGKYYVWEKAEIEAVLGENRTAWFSDYYDITEKGNWEHTNILRRLYDNQAFAQKNNWTLDELKEKLARAKADLLAIRYHRVPPLTDDKILLGWNALMNTAYSKAAKATQNADYQAIAQKNMAALLAIFAAEDGHLLHTYKDGKCHIDAFLDDYAYLIEALIELSNGLVNDTFYLQLASTYTDFVLSQYYEAKENSFYFANSTQTDLLVRKKDLYDNALPSGNGTMFVNLLKLGALLQNDTYLSIANGMLNRMSAAIGHYTSSLGKWAEGLLLVANPIWEIAVVGEDAGKILAELQTFFVPNAVWQATTQPNDNFPLLANRSAIDNKTTIYICHQNTCFAPIFSVDAFQKQLENHKIQLPFN